MFLDSLRTLSFKYAKCIIPRNLMYLYILKSYYRLKVLYHAIPPFAMDLFKTVLRSCVVAVWSSGTIPKASHKQVSLQRVYLTDTANDDGGMELRKLPGWTFIFLISWRVGFLDFLKGGRLAKQHNWLVVFKVSVAYTDFENEIWIAVCKWLQLPGDALDISNGANL